MIALITRFESWLKTRIALFVVLGVLLVLNISIYSFRDSIDFPTIQSRWDAVGLSHEKASQFVYFFYYTGYFPLATLNEDLVYSHEAAFDEINNRGDDLIMEYKHWSRLGENLRIWAYMPDSWINASPKKPSVTLFNMIVFCLGLMALFWGFWKVGMPIMGILLIGMINFTPYYLFEIYGRENIFGLMGSIFFFILGLNLPILWGKIKNGWIGLGAAFVSGMAINFIVEIRNETAVVIAALIILYILSHKLSWVWRCSLVLVAIMAYKLSNLVVLNYFENKFEEVSEVVETQGGHVYTGRRVGGHKLYHPLVCGLGDFGGDKGFAWDDKIWYKYAIPILQEKYGLDLKYSGGLHLDEYYDENKLYYIKLDEIPEYEEIMKDKLVEVISEDPLWYFSIILRRVLRTMSRTIPLPLVGWLLFPLLYYLGRERKWNFFKLLIIPLPLSATSIIVYSGKGSTYNSVFVYFIIAIILIELYQRYKVGSENKADAGSV